MSDSRDCHNCKAWNDWTGCDIAKDLREANGRCVELLTENQRLRELVKQYGVLLDMDLTVKESKELRELIEVKLGVSGES